MPRPDKATYDSVSTFLGSELDCAAAIKPNAGTLPLLHRLSRTEYQNAVRDLLALEALPKEMVPRRPTFNDSFLFFTAGKTEGGFDRGIEKALRRVLVSPQFMFRIETEPANAAPGALQVRGDAFNAFNHVNYANPNFGRLTSAPGWRTGQVSGRLTL